MPDCGAYGAVNEVPQLTSRLVLPAGDLLDVPAERLADLLDGLLEARSFLVGQLREGVGRHDFALLHRREDEPHGGLEDGQSLLFRLLAKLSHLLVVPAFELVRDGLLSSAVLLAVERVRNGGSQILDELRDVLLERGSPAWLHEERARHVGAGEVGDVTDVVRHALGGRSFGQQLQDGGVLAGVGGAHGVEVVAVRAHRDAELERLDGSPLSDAARDRLELGRGLEGELARVAPQAQFGRRGFARRALRPLVARWLRSPLQRSMTIGEGKHTHLRSKPRTPRRASAIVGLVARDCRAFPA